MVEIVKAGTAANQEACQDRKAQVKGAIQQAKATGEDNLNAFPRRSLKPNVAGSGGKMSMLIFGHKGDGKTFTAMLLGGRKLVISLDEVSDDIAYEMGLLGLCPLNGDIEVYQDEVMDEYTVREDKWTEAAARTLKKILDLIEEAGQREESDRPDWIIIDFAEKLGEITEGAMRHKFGLTKFEAFADLGLWKKRKEYLVRIYEDGMKAAKCGVVFTAYRDYDDKKYPKYTGIIEERIITVAEISIVAQTERGKAPTSINDSVRRLEIRSGKRTRFMPTGQMFMLDTDEGISQFVNTSRAYFGMEPIEWVRP